MLDSSLTPLAAFAAVAAILVVTPGVGTASLVNAVVTQGRRAGYQTALGMVIGGLVYALAAALGTTVLLRLFPRAVSWIAIGGGVFVVWLGLRGVIVALRGAPAAPTTPKIPRRHAFLSTGVLIALGNAPLPLFYLVVVPQYVPKSMSPLPGALLLSFIHLGMAATWMITLVTLLGRVVVVLRRPRVLLAMQLLTGTALILLGAQAIRGAI